MVHTPSVWVFSMFSNSAQCKKLGLVRMRGIWDIYGIGRRSPSIEALRHIVNFLSCDFWSGDEEAPTSGRLLDYLPLEWQEVERTSSVNPERLTLKSEVNVTLTRLVSESNRTLRSGCWESALVEAFPTRNQVNVCSLTARNMFICILNLNANFDNFVLQ